MKFSETWLRELVNIKLSSEALSNQITMAGMKVDSIKSVADVFNGVVVGNVVECKQHQNVDKLYVMKVDVGSKHLLRIVCTAPNCRQGLKVAVATVGAALPGNVKVEIANLYGELSEGILCSFSKLGISEDHNDNIIIELPDTAPIGTDIREYLKLNDNTIDISVTPNRADCLSIIGLARDVAAINQIEFNEPKIMPVTATVNDILPIQVDVPEACPRYLGRVILDIDIKVPTPLWMKEKLRRCGFRSVNVVVDITNYVLLELGQPMHAFDKNKIEGGIIVRMATARENIVLLDDNEVRLSTDVIVASDYNKVLTIAGIYGGKYSSVNRQTRNVLLECALFNPTSIRGQARRYGLQTDSSYRYERGVDPALQHKAIERATYLLLDICGGHAGPIIDVTSKVNLPKRVNITLHRSKLNRLIGYHITDMQINDILHRLGFEITYTQDEWQVIAPSWRFDIEIEEDLVEEIARIYGYNNIPNKPVQAGLIIRNDCESTLSLKRVKSMLNDKGYQEVITYSFIDPKLQQLIHPGRKALILPNPISREMSAMRLSLWTGLLGTVVYNQNRQQSRVRIFEVGICFIPSIHDDMDIRQNLMLAGLITGNRHEDHWDLAKDRVDFYDMKGDLESILDLTGKLFEIEFRAERVPALHPGQSAAIYLRDECIGFIGVIHPELERKFNLNGFTVVFELEWNKIAHRLIPSTKKISRFPMNRRDIAIIVAENIPAAAILAECKKVAVNNIVNVNLFDVYRGKKIADGYKSLAISLILQNVNRTLEEEEIAAIVAKCVQALKDRFQASLRD